MEKEKERRGGGHVAWLAEHVCLQLVATDILEFHFR